MTEPETPTVGFMNPPKNTQFQRGKSGNPRGRPRKPKDNNTILQQVLDRKVRLREGDRQITIRNALISKLRELSLQGDKRALALQRKIMDEAGLATADAQRSGEVKERVLKAFENMGVKVNRDK